MMPANRQPASAQRWVFLGVVLLLALHFGLAVGSKFQQSTTSDEIVHLAGGLSYWKFDDYRLQPENGNLPQRWAALPAWIVGAKFPLLDHNIYWRTSDVWNVGHQFFYEIKGQDHFPLLMAGRAMIALFSVGTGLLIFCWSRRLFGTTGGFISLTFFVFSPNFLAHGALATSDVCMVFFLLAAVGAYWRHLHDGRWTAWAISATVFGLACVAKFSAVLLLPMMAIMGLVRLGEPAPLQLAGKTFATTRGRWGAVFMSALGHAAVGWLIIWAFYGFRYSAFNPAVPPADHFIRPWDWMLQGTGLQGRVISWLRGWHALPEAFLYGYTYVVRSTAVRGAFLNGEYGIHGWVSFFPYAFLYKTPIPFLLASSLGLALVLGGWVRAADDRWPRVAAGLRRATPLLVLFVVYWAISLASHLNIGHRHILPTYPVLFILAGALGYLLTRQTRLWAAVVAGLMVWDAGEALHIHPYYLAYFNQIAGGPENGWRHLVDSSLDWGQDLPGLKDWLDLNAPDEPVFLAYFGSGRPSYYGINATELPFLNNFVQPRSWYEPKPGVYCISATMLQQVYSPVRPPWSAAYEKEYQSLRRLAPLFQEYFNQPDRRAELESQAPGKWIPGWIRFDLLRFARLCEYLRARKPDAMIGYSIFVYRLNADELHDAVGGTYLEWEQAIQRVSQH